MGQFFEQLYLAERQCRKWVLALVLTSDLPGLVRWAYCQSGHGVLTSIAQIGSEVKGLAVHVTSLFEKEAKCRERTSQMLLTCVESIKAQMKEFKGGC